MLMWAPVSSSHLGAGYSTQSPTADLRTMTLMVVSLYGLDFRYSMRSLVMGDSLGANGEESTRSSFAAKETGTMRVNRAAEKPSCAARRKNRRRVIFLSRNPAANCLNSSSSERCWD